MSKYTPYKYQHPTLGSLTGRLSTQSIISETAEVVQFRSVPFATIPARFRLAQGPLDHIPEDYDSRPHRDFTKWGYACPQIEQPRDAGGGSLGEDDRRQYDEFACLNCTITAPRKALEGDMQDLPVMVYVHGGAFVEGCGNISASHDTSRMVALSVEEDMPVVIVSLGYRLNWFGFFTCSDLLAEARNNGDGFIGNLGFLDQRLGFQFVQRQIAGFGGDPTNITAFGESAGSISLTHHLCASEPMFKRVILQSGTAESPGLDLERRDQMYEGLLSYLHIEDTTPHGKLEALRKAPVDRMVQAVKDLKLGPAFPYADDNDPFYANGPPTWSTINQKIEKNDWCKEIILGDTSFEGFMLIEFLPLTATREKVLTALRSPLQEVDAEAICKYYDINPDLDDNLFWTNVARFIGDIFLSEPTDRVIQGLTSSPHYKTYRYQVCLSNPFPGSKYSYVTGHHFVELMYLFLTYLERYPTHRNGFFANAAKEMARGWIAFANGRPPWKEYSETTGYSIAIFDDFNGLNVRTRDQDQQLSKSDVWGGRRYEGWELIRRALKNAGDSDGARATIMRPFL